MASLSQLGPPGLARSGAGQPQARRDQNVRSFAGTSCLDRSLGTEGGRRVDDEGEGPPDALVEPHVAVSASNSALTRTDRSSCWSSGCREFAADFVLGCCRVLLRANVRSQLLCVN